MSWGIEFTAYLNRVTKDQIESEIEETESFVRNDEHLIHALAAASPFPVKDSEGVDWDWFDYMSIKANETIKSMRENYMKLALLYQAKESGDVKDA